MSYREKSAWITLLSTLGVYAAYFTLVARHADADSLSLAPLLISVLTLIMVQVVLHTIARATSRDATAVRPTARARAVEQKSNRLGQCLMAAAGAGAAAGFALGLTGSQATQVLLAGIVAAEIARNAFVIASYRSRSDGAPGALAAPAE